MKAIKVLLACMFFALSAQAQSVISHDFIDPADGHTSGTINGVTDVINILGGYQEGGSDTLTNSVDGNAGTATALQANGGNCSAGEKPSGVDASGAVEGCTDVIEESELSSLGDLNTQLGTTIADGAHTAAGHGDGANCAAGTFPLGVDGAGAAQSCTSSLAGNATTATALVANPSDCPAGEGAIGIDADGTAVCSAYEDSATGVDGSTQAPTANALFDHDANASAHHTATVNTDAESKCTGTNVLEGSGSCVANSGGGSSGVDAKTLEIESADGATQNANCFVVIVPKTLNDPSSDLTFTSTTTANVNGKLGVLTETCAPGATCTVQVEGRVTVNQRPAVLTLGFYGTTFTTRCEISNQSALNGTSEGDIIAQDAGGDAVIWLGQQ